ncbi:MAG: iron ABC transporter permease, partial [Cyanobacteria bacterium J06639_1]
TVARFGAVELPAGAVTALLGSPFFLWLLYRRSAA